MNTIKEILLKAHTQWAHINCIPSAQTGRFCWVCGVYSCFQTVSIAIIGWLAFLCLNALAIICEHFDENAAIRRINAYANHIHIIHVLMLRMQHGKSVSQSKEHSMFMPSYPVVPALDIQNKCMLPFVILSLAIWWACIGLCWLPCPAFWLLFFWVVHLIYECMQIEMAHRFYSNREILLIFSVCYWNDCAPLPLPLWTIVRLQFRLSIRHLLFELNQLFEIIIYVTFQTFWLQMYANCNEFF